MQEGCLSAFFRYAIAMLPPYLPYDDTAQSGGGIAPSQSRRCAQAPPADPFALPATDRQLFWSCPGFAKRRQRHDGEYSIYCDFFAAAGLCKPTFKSVTAFCRDGQTLELTDSRFHSGRSYVATLRVKSHSIFCGRCDDGLKIRRNGDSLGGHGKGGRGAAGIGKDHAARVHGPAGEPLAIRGVLRRDGNGCVLRITPAACSAIDCHKIGCYRRGLRGDFQGGADRGLLIILGRPIADNKGIFRAGGQAGKYRAVLPVLPSIMTNTAPSETCNPALYQPLFSVFIPLRVRLQAALSATLKAQA